jgi:hypothetical protein
LRKYYPRNAAINEKNKPIYIILLLDPWIKRDDLESTGISSSAEKLFVSENAMFGLD